MKDTVNAFIELFQIDGAEKGPLTGKTFGAKDLYDIAGHTTGCGNPDWAKSHPQPDQTAPAVQMLLDAGATLVGKTHTDEIAYSLMGVNAHYGTPINAAATDRIPGGSSSGSVAAVTAGLVDVGLGSDTGGSVRMPASFCGTYGIRTTHGLIDISCAMPLAPSFDTVGWFARDPGTMVAAGAGYNITTPDETPPVRLLVAQDCMARTCDDGVASFDPTLRTLQDLYGDAEVITLFPGDLKDWCDVFKVCQAAEVWAAHGEWVTKTNPSFGPGVKERFELASSITPDMASDGLEKRAEIKKRMTDLLGDDGVILLPSSPGAAPLRSADPASLDNFRMAALDLLCAAGLCGLPQISLPAGKADGAPLGLSLITKAKDDGTLLAIARDIENAT